MKIRMATVKDVPTIRNFIQALADYEKLSHEMVATDADLESSLFSDNPGAEVLIAEEKDAPGQVQAVGFALFFHNYSTFLGKRGMYLEDLFVLPEHRGKGYGKGLLKELARIAVNRECGRLEWSVLDWNTPAIDFYKSIGAQFMHGWTVNRLTDQTLTDLAES
ncbi:MAG TPA: GNAT family N-acetyltransferase [Aeromonadales bacterium]|nr:GNAT family N-acetyltransferase [Aeromonadales bacterium]